MCRPHSAMPTPTTAIEAAEREHEVRGDQQRRADGEHAPAVHAIREPARGIRRQRVRDVHDDEHGRHVAHAQADVGDLQDQERFAEAGEREQRGDEHEPPEARRRACRAMPRASGRGAPRCVFARGGSRTNSTSTTTEASAGTTASQNTVRNASAVAAISAIASSGPANAPTVSSVCRKPNAAPRIGGRRQLGDQRVARRAANAFADAVEAARREHPAGGRREREQRLRERREPVAQDRQQLALAEPVADRAREHLRDRRDGLGRAFEQADGGHAGAEHADQEHRQQGVDHLRGDVHEQADEAERPYAARDAQRYVAGRATC